MYIMGAFKNPFRGNFLKNNKLRVFNPQWQGYF